MSPVKTQKSRHYFLERILAIVACLTNKVTENQGLIKPYSQHSCESRNPGIYEAFPPMDS